MSTRQVLKIFRLLLSAQVTVFTGMHLAIVEPREILPAYCLYERFLAQM